MMLTKPWLSVRLRPLGVSFRVSRPTPWVLGGLCLLLVFLVGLHVSQGEYPIPLGAVMATLLGLPAADPNHAFVVLDLRLPRALVAALVGMGLAIAGTIIQGLTRNPLAAPEIIGINAGAGLGALLLLVLFPSMSLVGLPMAAFGGGLAAAIAIYALAWNRGSSPLRLILMGIGLTALLGALTNVLVTFGEINVVGQALVWLTGSVYGRGWQHVGPLVPWLLGAGAVALLLARDLNTLHLGDEVAQSLGIAVERQRSLLLLCAVALAGVSVAIAGNISFVGLMAPHLSRQLVGPSHEGLLPTAALVGGCMVTLADLLGRLVFAPLELPCGVVTAVVGAPYFLYLLYRNRNA